MPDNVVHPGVARFERCAGEIPGVDLEQVESFNRFPGHGMDAAAITRGARKQEIDFGGCRCQTALLTGDASLTDPVTARYRRIAILIDRVIGEVNEDTPTNTWVMRKNPVATPP